jgi:TRAP-type C4-dicarboxylate transport system substrate-binding protein
MSKGFKSKSVWALIIMMVIFLSLSSSAMAQQKKIVFKACGALPGDNARILLEAFKDALELLTEFKVQVDMFDEGVFGGQIEAYRGTRRGVPDFYIGATNNLSLLSQSFGGALSLPYLFEDERELMRLMETPTWKELSAKLAKESGLMWVGSSIGGWRWILNSKRPIQTIQDMKGLKIRVPEVPQYLAAYKSWGAPGTPMAWNEVPGAMQQGVIDGLDNPPNVMYAFKFYETAKYFTEIRYALLSATLVMGEENFKKQPKEIQEAIVRAGEAAMKWQHDLHYYQTDKVLMALKGKGVQITRLQNEQEAIKLAKGTWPELYDRCGGKDWVMKLDKEVEAVRASMKKK